jgi:hypothetical protein
VTRLVFHLIPHTHWDREWYLSRAAFGARLVLMMDDLMTRLEQNPDFRSFLLDGQTILISDYLHVRPGEASRVEALVRAERLQIGPWYVLADEQIPSGESLIRNLLLGREQAEQLGGRLDVLYSPDAFGHPAMLPDLAREFSLPAGVLWRGLDPQLTNGRDLVRWRGPAGGDTLIYHLPPAGYEAGSGLFAAAPIAAGSWRSLRDTLVDRATGPHVAVFLGADHHWAHPSVPRLRDCLAALEPDHEVRVSRLDEFLGLAAQHARNVPVVNGELRWSYGYTWNLQGVHSTRAPIKRENSRLELLLERVAEPLVALSGPATGLRALLSVAWHDLLAGQFHDVIGGCSSDTVARDSEARLRSVQSTGQEIVRRAVQRLCNHVPDRARESPGSARPRLLLWNPAARPRSGVVLADTTWFRRDVLVGPPGEGRLPRRGPGAKPFALVSDDGAVLSLQPVGRQLGRRRLDADRHYPDQDEVDVVRVALSAPHLAGLGFELLTPRPGAEPVSGPVRAGKAHLRNELVEVSIGPGGAINLTDRRSGERYVGLLRLEDETDAGDTYTFGPGRPRGHHRSREPVRTRVLAAGPLVGVLEGRWTFAAARVGARLVLRVHAGSPLVHVRLQLDNRAGDHRLRARIPTGLGGTTLLTGAQFGAFRRAPARFDPRDYPNETPVPTAPVHRFAAAARGPRGLALLLPGFGEIEWTQEGDLLMTLLRAVGRLSRGDLPTRPGHAGWPEPTPLAQCAGLQVVELAVAPIDEPTIEHPDQVVALWEDAFLPIQAFWLPDSTELACPPDTIALEGEGLVLSAVKPAEESADGVVLRCYNARAKPVDGCWRFGRPRREAWRVRADERGIVEAGLIDEGRALPFRAEALAWVTHLVRE